MNISELIETLEIIKKEKGNLEVKLFHERDTIRDIETICPFNKEDNSECIYID